MFLGRRRASEPKSEESVPPEGDAVEKEQPEKTLAEAEGTLVTQIGNLEELVNKRDKDLEEAKEQLRQLCDTAGSSAIDEAERVKKAEELLTQPNKPGGELVELPAGESVAKEGAGAAPEEKADNLLKQTGEAALEKPETEEESLSSADDFFGEQEEVENPLAGLIASLPDVTTEELLRDIEGVAELVREWQQGEE